MVIATGQWGVPCPRCFQTGFIVVAEGPSQPTVEDVDRRCLELMEGDRTVGEIRRQLVSEFGSELVEQSRARHSS